VSAYNPGMISRSATSSASVSRAPSCTYDVVVAGAGLVGSAVALAAAQANLRVALVSGASLRSATGSVSDEKWDRRVYAISPASRRFLEATRVWAQLDGARVSPVRDMQVFPDEFGAAPVRFSAYEASEDALAWIIEHRELARVFNAALGFQQGVDRIDDNAFDFQADGSRVVVQAGHKSLHAALLIAADGPHSSMREKAGIKIDVKPYGEIGVVANFACSNPHGDVARQWFTTQGTVALLPLCEQAVSLVWSAPKALANELLSELPEALAHRVEQFAGSALGSLSALGGSSGFALSLLETPTQIGRRVVIVGDAAHVIHPLAGQGLNLGFSDARTLIEVLRKREFFRDCGDPVLLRRYERARKEEIWAMQYVTDGLQRMFASNDPTLRRVRAAGMKLVDRLPFLKQVLMRQAMG